MILVIFETKQDMVSERVKKVGIVLRKNLLTILLCVGIIVGIALGFILRYVKDSWTQREIMYLGFIGDLFLRMLKVLILPLIIASIISALGELDIRLSGKITLRALVFYLSTTFLAVILGIVLVLLIQPGRVFQSETAPSVPTRNITTADTLLDLVRNMVPDNIVKACMFQYRTLLIYPAPTRELKPVTNETDRENPDIKIIEVKDKDGNVNEMEEVFTETTLPINEWDIQGEYIPGSNIMGLVAFSVVLGIIIGRYKEKCHPLLVGFTAIADAMMIFTHWVIWISPIGIIFLVCSKIVEMEDFRVFVGQLGLYFLTVLLGLAIQGMIILPSIFAVTTRRLPFRFIANLSPALITAWATSSSSATLPVTIACIEERNHVDPRVARFVLPIGATMNMDGTALYEAVATIFIAQVRKVELDVGSVIAISITATAASIGAAGIPQAGLVTMVMVLNVVGLPAEDISIILIVDWLLDRFRTVVNVLGDSIGAGIVDALSKKDLEALDKLPPVGKGSEAATSAT